MEEDLSVTLWKQQRRGTLGCGFLAVLLASTPAALLYFFAPSWAFWLAVVPLGLFTLAMLFSTVRELRRVGVFLHEHSGKWRTATPKKRSLAEVQSVWLDLKDRQQRLVQATAEALGWGVQNPALLGEVVTALEEEAEPFERGYWASVTLLNHYEAEIRTLRTLVRKLMPTDPPEGDILELMEQWLSQMIEEMEAFRHAHVLEGKTPFVDELVVLLAGHNPPMAIQKAVESQPQREA